MTSQRALVIAAAIAGARLAAAGPVTGEPEVRIIELAADTAGSGQITLRNTSASNLTVTSIAPTAGCAEEVSVPAAGFGLAAGATHTLPVRCDAAPPSMRRCTFEARSSAGVVGDFEAVCAYAGAASLTAPASVDLGTTPIGTTKRQTITIHNPGAATARAFLALSDRDDFSLAAPCNPDAHACDAGVSVPAGGNLPVTINCTPHSLGAQAAELHVVTAAGTRLVAPVALSCAGTAAGRPVLAERPAVIDVGAVAVVGATATATIHLGNAGTATVTVRDLQLADNGTGAAGDWTVAPCTACAIGPTDAVDLALTFDPSAIGARDATLILGYHDIADRSLSIPLHGVGNGPAFELATPVPGVDFGTLPLDRLATLPLTVINRGSVALDDARITLVPPVAAFSASLSPISIPAGGTATLNVSCQLSTPTSAATTLRLDAPDAVTPVVDVPLHCAASDTATVFANPPALQLGELRLGPTTAAVVQLQSAGAPVAIGPASLVTADPRFLSLTLSGATTPAALTARVSATSVGPLTNQILVGPPPLSIAVTGSVVSPDFEAADVVSLGTFCVDQPTTPRMLAFTATGTATLALTAAPALQHASAPFDLKPVSPLSYPASIAPGTRALIAVTPRRQATAGLVSDAVRWATDIATHTVVVTQINATFVDDGGAIAPSALAFPSTPIHLDTTAPQQVTLQNCSTSPLELGAPQIEAPFSIDSPAFPTVVLPGELATFSVGFHPTQVGSAAKTLTIASPQLPDAPLTVALFGIGVAGDDPDGSNPPGARLSPTSFYACDSCASGAPSSALAWLGALLVVLRRRARPRA